MVIKMSRLALVSSFGFVPERVSACVQMAPPRSDHELRDMHLLRIDHKLCSGSEVRVFGIELGI